MFPLPYIFTTPKHASNIIFWDIKTELPFCQWQAIPENKRRVVITKGLCIARRNRAFRTSFTIRNHLGAAGGIERTFPLRVIYCS